MLSYQHDYHAGNHADVLKHSVLAILIRALQRKPTAMRVIDTHAGSGQYDLDGALPRRGGEFQHGIQRLLAAEDPPAPLAPYLQAIRSLNPAGGCRHYPGSPRLAHSLLRTQDHLELFELHPRASAALRVLFGRDRQVHIHQRDGYEGLRGALPPPERRGLVLIDPSYEEKAEYGWVADAVAAAHARWPGGVLAIWYPLIRHGGSAGLVRRLGAMKLPGTYRAEVEVAPDATGLRGSGMVVVNLPYRIDTVLDELVPWLLRCLNPDGHGRCNRGWLA
jgi:23S rRNA (adenine2030-N6)-methyltransferase